MAGAYSPAFSAAFGGTAGPSGSISVQPASASLAVTPGAPTLAQATRSGAFSVDWSGSFNSVTVAPVPAAVQPGPAALTFVGFAPSVGQVTRNDYTDEFSTEFGPRTTVAAPAQPASAAMTLTGQAPTVTTSVPSLQPASATLTVATAAPGLGSAPLAYDFSDEFFGEFTTPSTPGTGEPGSGNVTVAPAPATLVLTSRTPSVPTAGPSVVAAPAAVLSVATTAPIANVLNTAGAYSTAYNDDFDIGLDVAGALVIRPEAAALVLSRATPVVIQPASDSVTVPPAALTLTRFAPSVSVAGPPVRTGAFSPDWSGAFDKAARALVSPDAAVLLCETFAPTIRVPANIVLRPAPAAAVRILPGTPTVVTTGNVAVAPAPALLVFRTFAPPDPEGTWAALALLAEGRFKLRSGGLLLLQVEAPVAHVKAPPARSVAASYGLAALAWSRPLDPNEIVFYTIDWSEELGGTSDSIASDGSQWILSGAAISAGITTTGNAHTYDSNSATVWLSVEPARQEDAKWLGQGETHQITHRINTVGGQVLERSVNFIVKSFQS